MDPEAPYPNYAQGLTNPQDGTDKLNIFVIEN